MNNEETLAAVDVTIEQANEAVSMASALDKLSTDPNFIKVILDGYLKDEAVRSVLLRGDPSMQSDENQAQVLKAIDSIAQLRQYFIATRHIGQLAEKAIIDANETRAEIYAEEAE